VSKETRILDSVDFEVRADEETGTRTLVGYGAVFGKLSQDLGGFREVIEPAAFNRTVQNNKDILVTMNHNVDQLLGRSGAGTARISVDEVGVRYEVDLPDTATGRTVEVLASRGDLFGSSFTFSVPDKGATVEKDEDGRKLRRLHEVRLYELGPVVSPAYLDTTVALRSIESYVDTEEEEDRSQEEEEEETRTPVHSPKPNPYLGFRPASPESPST
jgi:hypothetical protein